MDQLKHIASFGAVAALGLALRLGAQSPPLVTAGFDTLKWVAPRQAIELHVIGDSLPTGSRLAVVLGSTDLSALFRAAGDTLRYQSQLLALPPGEQPLVVYVVGANHEWTELARFPLRVLT